MKIRLTLITVLSLLSSLVRAEQPFSVVYFNNYAPFSWEEHGEMHGIIIDVLNEVIPGQMNVPIVHRGYPWKRAQLMVRDGKADAFVTVPTQERRAYTYISAEPVVAAPFKLFVKAGNPRIADYRKIRQVADLQGIRLGNYLGNGWAKENLQGMEVDWNPSLDVTLKNLFHGRFELFVGASQVARFNIKRLGYEGKVIEIGEPLGFSPFNLSISKNSSYVYLIVEFDRIMKQLKSSGRLEAIYRQYR